MFLSNTRTIGKRRTRERNEQPSDSFASCQPCAGLSFSHTGQRDLSNSVLKKTLLRPFSTPHTSTHTHKHKHAHQLRVASKITIEGRNLLAFMSNQFSMSLSSSYWLKYANQVNRRSLFQSILLSPAKKCRRDDHAKKPGRNFLQPWAFAMYGLHIQASYSKIVDGQTFLHKHSFLHRTHTYTHDTRRMIKRNNEKQSKQCLLDRHPPFDRPTRSSPHDSLKIVQHTSSQSAKFGLLLNCWSWARLILMQPWLLFAASIDLWISRRSLRNPPPSCLALTTQWQPFPRVFLLFFGVVTSVSSQFCQFCAGFCFQQTFFSGGSVK